jgi:hypothetical protein
MRARITSNVLLAPISTLKNVVAGAGCGLLVDEMARGRFIYDSEMTRELISPNRILPNKEYFYMFLMCR